MIEKVLSLYTAMGKRTERPSTGNEPISKVAKSEAPMASTEISIRRTYPELYRKVKNDALERSKLFDKAKDEENVYRELFAQERNSTELNDLRALLIDVHKDQDIFEAVEESPEEAKVPRISSINAENTLKPECVVSQSEFKQNFALFTENQFSGVSWDNVLIAGGSILACLLPNDAKTPREKRNFFHKKSYKNSDIDIFMYGLDAKQANQKLIELYDAISQSLPGGEELICFRSQHAVTMISKFPYRHIQVILRLYKSPAEILMGFDVDACAVGYDGSSVLVTPRCHHAMTYRVNTVDMTRRSPSYEMRLSKYAGRGFAIVIPNLDERRIDPQIFERRFDQVQGLAKLILITKLETTAARYSYKEQQRMRKLRPEATQQTSLFDMLGGCDEDEDDEYNSERLENGAAVSDYSTVFLPWGPKWDAARIRKLMYTKDMVLNSKWYDPKKKFHTHPCFFGTALEVIKDCCGSCPPVPEADVDPDTPFVSGEITWLDINPGQQTQLKRIGSFHPITEGDWTEGAYISSEIESVCAAVNTGDIEALKELCQDGTLNLNQRDASGRTPLHIAAFSNTVEAAAFLLEKGARVSSRMTDGRTPLHICAQYGHYQIISSLIARGAFLEEEAEAENEMDTSGDKEEEGEEEEEEEEGDEDEDEDGDDSEMDGECIKDIVEERKKEAASMLEKMNPFKSDDEPDALDIEATDWDMGYTALQFACFFGRAKAIRILVSEGGADLLLLGKARGLTTAMLAASNGHKRAVGVLFDLGYPLDHLSRGRQNILQTVASQLDIPMTQLIMKQKSFNTLPDSCMESAVKAPITKEKEEEKGKKTPVYYEYGMQNTMKVKIKYIKMLLKHGGSFVFKTENGEECSHLFHAIHTHSPELVELMLSHEPSCVHVISGNSSAFDVATEQAANAIVAAPTHYSTNLSSLLEISNEPIPLVAYEKTLNLLKGVHKEQKNQPLFKHIIEQASFSVEKFLKNTFPTKKQVPEAAQRELAELRKKTKKQEKTAAITALIHAAGGKAFISMKFTKAALKKMQSDKKKNSSGYNTGWRGHPPTHNSPSFSFSAIGGNRWNRVSVPQEKLISLLFAATFESRADALEKVTRKAAIGKQAHVCSVANACGLHDVPAMTPLFLAMQNDDPPLLTTLLDIAVAQFTPLSRKKKEGFVPTINNHDLMKLVKQNIKPGDYLDISGKAIYHADEFEEDDPNAKSAIQLNCTCSPSALLLFQSHGFSVMHIAAQYDHVESAEALYRHAEKCQIPYFRIIDEEDKSGENKDTSTRALLADLVCPPPSQEWNGCKMNPFHVAVISGNLAISKWLLAHGGLRVITDEDLPEVYTGLDVGGQKMDWALDHHASEENLVSKHSACHLAAFYNQPDMIEFLIKEAPAIWKEHYSKSFPDRTLPDIPDDFFLNRKGKTYKYTPLHISCFWGPKEGCTSASRNHGRYNRHNRTLLDASTGVSRLAVAKKILELDAALYGNGLLNMTSKKDLMTPLMIAAHNGVTDVVKLLLSHNAIVDYQCKKGWTALHYAVRANQLESTTLLLDAMTRQQVNLASKTFKQTAFIISAFTGNVPVMQALIHSNKCDLFARDVAGDFALHHAIRNQKVECVKLLIDNIPEEDYQNDFLKENGVNQTALDVVILSALSNKGSEKTWAILKLVYGEIGYERHLSQYKFVRGITDVMIEQTVARSKKGRNNDNQDEGDWTHTIDIDEPEVPSLPSVFLQGETVDPKSVSTKQYIDFYKS